MNRKPRSFYWLKHQNHSLIDVYILKSDCYFDFLNFCFKKVSTGQNDVFFLTGVFYSTNDVAGIAIQKVARFRLTLCYRCYLYLFIFIVCACIVIMKKVAKYYLLYVQKIKCLK